MYSANIDADAFLPFMIFAIPIVAIVGGITAGIVRTIGHQRLVELAQRERIAAIERGVDPSKLPPIPSLHDSDDPGDAFMPFHERSRRRSQGLLIGGLVTLAVGISLGVFLNLVSDERGVWAIGLIPGSVGVALLISAWLVKPRNGGMMGPTSPPRSS